MQQHSNEVINLALDIIDQKIIKIVKMKIIINILVLCFFCSCGNKEQNIQARPKISKVLECNLRKNNEWGCDTLNLKHVQTDSSSTFTYFDNTGQKVMEFNDYDTLKGLDRTILKFISKKSIHLRDKKSIVVEKYFFDNGRPPANIFYEKGSGILIIKSFIGKFSNYIDNDSYNEEIIKNITSDTSFYKISDPR